MFHRPVNSIAPRDRAAVCVTQLNAKLLERGLAATPGSVPTFSAAVGGWVVGGKLAVASAGFVCVCGGGGMWEGWWGRRRGGNFRGWRGSWGGQIARAPRQVMFQAD